MQHVPQAPPSESESRPAWLSRSTWHWHASTYDTLVTIVSPLRWLHVESKQYRLRRRPASGRQKRSPGAPWHHQASVGLVRRPSPFVRSMEPPWCGNPYCTANGTAVGTDSYPDSHLHSLSACWSVRRSACARMRARADCVRSRPSPTARRLARTASARARPALRCTRTRARRGAGTLAAPVRPCRVGRRHEAGLETTAAAAAGICELRR